MRHKRRHIRILPFIEMVGRVEERSSFFNISGVKGVESITPGLLMLWQNNKSKKCESHISQKCVTALNVMHSGVENMYSIVNLM